MATAEEGDRGAPTTRRRAVSADDGEGGGARGGGGTAVVALAAESAAFATPTPAAAAAGEKLPAGEKAAPTAAVREGAEPAGVARASPPQVPRPRDKEDDGSVSALADSLAAATVDRFAPRRAIRKASFRTGMSLAESQEERRRKRLEEQRQRRRDLTDHARAVAFDRVPVATEESSEESLDEDRELEEPPTRSLKRSLEDDEQGGHPAGDGHKKQRLKRRLGGPRRNRTKKKNPYAGQLMLAEEMFEVPSFEELSEDWYSVLCPIGKRCLVVSSSGKTVSRLKSGRIFDVFQSALPAGAKEWRGSQSNEYCILDCIFDQEKHVYYVLDVMCWKGYPVYDCETEFRFYWLQMKFQEINAAASSAARGYAYPFAPLSASECSWDGLAELARDPAGAALARGFKCDGMLLFHKRTHYELGNTPLVGWIPAARIRAAFVREVDMDAAVDVSPGGSDAGGRDVPEGMAE